MARFDKKGFLRGVFGKLVFRVRKEQQEVSLQAVSINQTVATKEASGTFGKASSLSRITRDILVDDLLYIKDEYIHSNLTSQWNTSLNECRDAKTKTFIFEQEGFNGFVNFNFNSALNLSKKLPGKMNIGVKDGLLNAAFPSGETAKNLKFVKGSTACSVSVSVLLFRLKEKLCSRIADRQDILVKKSAPALNGIEFSFAVPNDCLCLVAVTLRYFNGSVPLGKLELNASAICDALVIPGIYDESRKFKWADTGVVFD